MKFIIEYEHLRDELIINEKTKHIFNVVRDNANKYKLELTDDDFRRFFELEENDKDMSWIMHKISVYGLSLTDALISYICC